MTLWPTFQLAQSAATVGFRHYTLGFVQSGDGCAAAWGGVIPLADQFALADIGQLRALGGDVIVSFGGAGQELSQRRCVCLADV
jgi:hypothetical protein